MKYFKTCQKNKHLKLPSWPLNTWCQDSYPQPATETVKLENHFEENFSVVSKMIWLNKLLNCILVTLTHRIVVETRGGKPQYVNFNFKLSSTPKFTYFILLLHEMRSVALRKPKITSRSSSKAIIAFLKTLLSIQNCF